MRAHACVRAVFIITTVKNDDLAQTACNVLDAEAATAGSAELYPVCIAFPSTVDHVAAACLPT